MDLYDFLADPGKWPYLGFAASSAILLLRATYLFFRPSFISMGPARIFWTSLLSSAFIGASTIAGYVAGNLDSPLALDLGEVWAAICDKLP